MNKQYLQINLESKQKHKYIECIVNGCVFVIHLNFIFDTKLILRMFECSADKKRNNRT